ncbi:MAG: hemin ABC transporter substrate-binding protein [Aquabacterium sp.]
MRRRDCAFALATAPCWLSAAMGSPRTSSPSPARIVSVHGCLTEVIYLLRAESQLVGTDTTSTYPSAAQQTTKVGYMRSLSAEGLLALRPTAVLGTEEAGPPVVLAQLRQAGVPVQLTAAQHRFEDVLSKVKAVGQATGRQDQAAQLGADLTRRWRQTQQRVAQARALRHARSAAAPRVLFLMAHGGTALTAGQDTGAHAVLDLLGVTNALQGVRGYKPLNAESAAAAQADIVLTTTESLAFLGGASRLWQLPGLAHTPAARHERLVALDAMGMLGFGPRMPAVLDELQRHLA